MRGRERNRETERDRYIERERDKETERDIYREGRERENEKKKKQIVSH